MSNKWDLRFLNLAQEVSSWSKDPSTKVGCVLVRPDLTIAGTGYNGFPRYMADNKELYDDRETKYSRTIHAELNAVLNSMGDLEGCTAYVTHPPCTNCALVLIQKGLSRVVAISPSRDLLSRWEASIRAASEFFAEAEVEFELIDGQRD